jgi:enoyl-CoA hydratase/carnithine racemase
MSHSSIVQYGPAITWVTSSTVMPSSNVEWTSAGGVGTLTFTRPHTRNALTWDMYDAVVDACDRAGASGLRVLVLRGAGESFAAGTDISHFGSFATGDDGIAYERRLDAVIDRLERATSITLAAVDGPAVGGGCTIALACDLRVCTPRARFGIPVARTLGNCLSAANTARLVDLIGPARTRDLLLTGRLMDADEARTLGLVTRLVDHPGFDDAVAAFADELSTRAGSTIVATKTILQRLREARRPPPADDVIAHCYASEDFREGVRAFLEGRPPRWRT